MSLSKESSVDARLLSEELVNGLERVGLVSKGDCTDPAGTAQAVPELRLFMPFLQAFRVRLVPAGLKGCPVQFCTGILQNRRTGPQMNSGQRLSVPAGGQAMQMTNAALSCIGEMVERVSLFVVEGSDSRIFLGKGEQPEVDFSGILGLSTDQESDVAKKSGLALENGTGPRVAWGDLTDRRVKLRNLKSENTAQLPSFAALYQACDPLQNAIPGFASSVGCAVWKDLEGARERALLELVERDAVAQFWYNRLGITSISMTVLRSFLPHALVDFLTQRGRKSAVFRVRTDLPVQVAAAISYGAGGYMAAFGSAAGYDLGSACQSAVEEMLQSEIALDLMDKAYPQTGTSQKGEVRLPRQLTYARQTSILSDLPLSSAVETRDVDLNLTSSPDALLEACYEKNLDIWEFDATRPDLVVPCIKLFSPDLCTWEPRFGKRRLFDGVVESGLRARPADEAEFAARPFPF